MISALALALALVGAAGRAAAQDLIVDGTTVTLGGTQRRVHVRVVNGGRIVVPNFNGDRTTTGGLRLIAEDITVDARSAIVADGAGYQTPNCRDGDGPAAVGGGRGGCRVRDSGGGGGHFGRGGQGTIDCPASGCVFPGSYEEACPGADDCSDTSNCRNGDAMPPTYGPAYRNSVYDNEMGAAGGDSGCRDGDGVRATSSGGPGGGAITLVGLRADGTGFVDIQGQVLARGARGCGWANDSGGGGAGGQIFVVGDRVTVGSSAQLRAQGGPGGSGASTGAGGWWNVCGPSSSTICDDCGGGGGGGLISIQSRTRTFDQAAVFAVIGGPGGGQFDGCAQCQGEAGGGAGELQLDGAYVGEVCDGYDNDFDGMVDEGLGTVGCGLGMCTRPLAACASGAPVTCSPATGPDPSCRGAAAGARPRVAVVLDTSASMLQDLSGYPTFGDGSTGHVGIDSNNDGTAGNDSRLFLARTSLNEVISAYPEIDFALARYHQDMALNRSCQTATQIECQGLFASYDNPTDNTDIAGRPASTCAVPIRPGVTIPVRPLSPGSELCINYAGSCGPPRRGADILSGFGSDVRQHVRWLDGRETNFIADATPGNVCRFDLGGDCEVRATGPTPLAGSLQAIEDYVVPIRTTDPATACRGYSVILVTDGAESCGGDPVAAARRLHDTFMIDTYVIAVSVLPEERASLDAIANAGSGGTRGATFVTMPAQLVPALTSIISRSIRFERCNGIDDNCNGLVDEGFPGLGNACDDGGVGVCQGTGTIQCRPDGTGTRCAITRPGMAPRAEVCNALDDNCNGRIDEGLMCGSTCTPSGPEVCNGMDDDCNGLVDESDPMLGMACGSTMGICTPGTLRCIRGTLQCVGATPARTETCNGVDEDCDGVIDNGAVCPPNSACIDGACRLPCDPASEFPCPFGFECLARPPNTGTYCIPTACARCTDSERCDNGHCVDLCQGVTCPNNGTCVRGECRDCRTLGCGAGLLCREGACVPDPCASVTCPAGQGCFAGTCWPACDDRTCAEGQRCNAAGQCVTDPCAGISCPPGRFCDGTMCRTDPCANAGCRAGQVCVSSSGGCVDDPCAGVRCPADRECRVMSAGVPVCAVPGDVSRVPRERVIAAGGGGPSCTVGRAPGAGHPRGELALCAAGLALALSRRARRRSK